MAESKKAPNQLNIELSEEVAEGIYSNLAIISHSNSEFVVDFIRIAPNVPKAKVVRVRSVMKPATGRMPRDSVSPLATIADAAPLFTGRVTRLKVVDDSGRELGVLERADVVDVMMRG